MAGEIYTATVETVCDLAPDVRELVLRQHHGGPLNYAPGQWISLRLPVTDRPPLIRAYTLATPAGDGNRLTLCFDRVTDGLGSEYLWTLGPGAEVEFTGPMGNFTLPDDGDLLFVAQYTGIVPFRAMVLHTAGSDMFPASGRRVHLVYGARRPEDLIYHEELAATAATVPWLDYVPVALEGAAAASGIQSGSELDVLRTSARAWLPFTPMLCGVREFTFPTRAFFMEELGFERRAVKVENYNGPTGR